MDELYSAKHYQQRAYSHSSIHSPKSLNTPDAFFPPKNTCEPIFEKTQGVSVWNDKLESAVKEIGEMSLSYKLMHIEMALRCHIRYNVLMYIGIISAPLSGIISQFNSPLSSCDNMYISFVALGISFISGIVVAIIKFSRYDEVEYANKLAASKYTSLESNVRRQLTLYRDNRVDAIEYMEWLTTSFDELFLSSPLLPHYLFDKYRKLAINNGHIPPNEYGNTININEEYEQTMMKNICGNDTIVVNTLNSSTSSQHSISIAAIEEHNEREKNKRKGKDIQKNEDININLKDEKIVNISPRNQKKTESKDVGESKNITESKDTTRSKDTTENKDTTRSKDTTENKDTTRSKDTTENKDTTRSKDTTENKDIRKIWNMDSKDIEEGMNTRDGRESKEYRRSRGTRDKENKDGNSLPLSEISDDNSKTSVKGNKTVKRTETIVPIQELNRYSDVRMMYQMRRFMQTSE
jgi:hypothetical protein